jgi:hypothetical protein
MKRVTASKVGLLEKCQAFAKDDMKWDDRKGVNADRGDRFHKAIAAWASGQEVPELADDIKEEFEQAKQWLIDRNAHTKIDVEVAFAWDPENDTAEILDIVDRAYPPSSRFCGTADVILDDKEADLVVVWDWKTGDGSNAGPQLRSLGLMAARALGRSRAIVAALEVRKSGVTEVAREDLDDFALAGIAGGLSETLAAVVDSSPKPGSHCGELYCPARLHCPVGQVAMAQVVDVIPASALVRTAEWKITEPIASAEQAIWSVDVLRLMQAWIDAKKDEIKSLVPKDGWFTNDGRVLKEIRATQKAFDKDKALVLCKQLGATDEQIASLTYTFNKSNGLRVSKGKAA